jgi:hypothetical protein
VRAIQIERESSAKNFDRDKVHACEIAQKSKRDYGEPIFNVACSFLLH